MGIPVDFPSSSSLSSHSRFTPSHSAKPSWSSQYQLPPDSNSPPPSVWDSSLRSPQSTYSSTLLSSQSSPSSTYISPIQETWSTQPQQQHYHSSESSNRPDITSRVNEAEIDSSFPTRVRSRMINREPVFILNPNSRARERVDSWESVETQNTNLEGSSSSGNTSDWDSFLPTREYYLTRPLPPPPPGRLQAVQTAATTANVTSRSARNYRGQIDAPNLGSHGVNGYYEDYRLRAEQQQQRQQQRQQHQQLYRDQPSVVTSTLYSSEWRRRYLYSREFQNEEIQDVSLPLSSSPSSSPTSSASSSSSRDSSLPITTLPSFLQGTSGSTRTVVQAHPGVIHIYPENHDPIYMYGRPILTSPPSSSSSEALSGECT